ncbi:MAG: S8 family serine peptidase [Phycisphaeraceae bacterium]|nr:S8 family serine peptidase [Phycisphaeraceae bacterium]MCW5762000.1 S8 family serine peptidase [Phycisphaeraceae bacterium]
MSIDGYRAGRLIVQLTSNSHVIQDQGHQFVLDTSSERATESTRVASALLNSWQVTKLDRAVHPQNEGVSRALGLDRFYFLDLPVTTDLDLRIRQLSAFSDLFVSVEKDRRGSAHLLDEQSGGSQFPLPNDPLFEQQYALENIGQSIRGYAGTVDADLNATAAWSVVGNRPGVVVAVLDSGISFSHPDLAGQIVQGRNFTSGNTEAIDDSWVSHGTHVAGIIAARTNNGIGVAGLAHKSSIMPVRIVDRFGFTFEGYLANGLIWAADNGAKVINISLGFESANSLHRAAVQYAAALDVVMCASSGNISTDPIGFPAALPETIAVGATNNRDEIVGFTSGGPQMDVAAPGRDIYSTWDTTALPDTYEYRSGTSFASPFVAATAALVRTLRPDLTAETIRQVIAASAKDIGPSGWDPFSGSGRIDAYQALLLARAIPFQGTRVCIADLNGDGSVDFIDIQLFLQAFSDHLPLADRNHDGLFDFFDVQSYLAEYSRDCQRQAATP